MAITYDSKITVLNVAKKLTSITVTRTDDEVDPVGVQTVRIQNCILATAEQKQAVELQIKNKLVAIENKNAQAAAIVGGLENTLTANLTAWELTR